MPCQCSRPPTLAKIYHDLRSLYSLIEKRLFDINYQCKPRKTIINYKFTDLLLAEKFRRNFLYVQDRMEKKYNKFENINYRADFTEAMLYLTMVPLHLRDHNEGLLCLTIGIQRLNEWFKNNYSELFQQMLNRVKPYPVKRSQRK